MSKGFIPSNFGSVSDNAEQEAFEQVEQLSSGADFVNNQIRVVDGLNVLWIIPPYSGMTDFVERIKVYYRPMHRSNRKGRVPNPDNPEKSVDDTNFNNCIRSQKAWEAYEAAGKPGTGDRDAQNPAKTKLKQDLGSDAGLFQAIDLSFFFKTKGEDIVLDEKRAEHLDAFFDAILDGSEDAVNAYLDRFGLSEDVKNDPVGYRLAAAIRAGVGLVTLNYAATNLLKKAERGCVKAWGRRKGLDAETAEKVARGPLLHPEAFLTVIERYNGQETFTSRGKERSKKVYDFSFLDPDTIPENWEEVLDLQKIWEVAQKHAKDLRNPDYGPDATLEERARGLSVLTNDEILQYLADCKHSFTDLETGSDEDADPEEPAAPSAPMPEPADFGPISGASTADDQETLAKLRRRRKPAAAE